MKNIQDINRSTYTSFTQLSYVFSIPKNPKIPKTLSPKSQDRKSLNTTKITPKDVIPVILSRDCRDN